MVGLNKKKVEILAKSDDPNTSADDLKKLTKAKKSKDNLAGKIAKITTTSKAADTILKKVKAVESTCMNNRATLTSKCDDPNLLLSSNSRGLTRFSKKGIKKAFWMENFGNMFWTTFKTEKLNP